MPCVASLRRLVQALFFPQCCVQCERWVCNSDWSPLCRDCLAGCPRLEGPICFYCGIPLPGVVLDRFGHCVACLRGKTAYDFGRAFGPYEGSLRKLIHHYKFDGFRKLAGPFGELLVETLHRSEVPFSGDWILPVPLNPRKRAERGFDQTLLLAQKVSLSLGIPLHQGLRRIRNTAPQFGLDLRARKKNLKQAFSLRATESLTKKEVLLIDDILTTGTTVNEICRLLRRRAKVKTIFVLTVARVPLIYSHRRI